MALGAGKYDDLLTEARQVAEADGGVLLIIDGNKGSGFSAQLSFNQTVAIPKMLRAMADQIEKDITN